MTQTCSHCAPSEKKQINRVWWVVLAIILTWVAGKSFAPLAKLAAVLEMYLGRIALPVLFGLLLGGVIDWLVPAEFVSKLLSGKKKRSIPVAVMAGFLMSACSHGILAISIQLYKKGASIPAVVAFLLASPWANLPVTILMFGFFGWRAFVIILSAILVAMLAGWFFMILSALKLIEKNPNTVESKKGFSTHLEIMKTIRKGGAVKAIWQGTVSLANMTLWWILVGALLSSFAGAFIPAHFIHHYMGASVLGLFVTLGIATVMEICSEGTAPLAFEIYRQTGALGNAFVFLMAGVVTDYTEIGLLWTNIGPRTAMWLPAVTVPMVVFLGYIFNKLL